MDPSPNKTRVNLPGAPGPVKLPGGWSPETDCFCLLMATF